MLAWASEREGLKKVWQHGFCIDIEGVREETKLCGGVRGLRCPWNTREEMTSRSFLHTWAWNSGEQFGLEKNRLGIIRAMAALVPQILQEKCVRWEETVTPLGFYRSVCLPATSILFSIQQPQWSFWWLDSFPQNSPKTPLPTPAHREKTKSQQGLTRPQGIWTLLSLWPHLLAFMLSHHRGIFPVQNTQACPLS